MAFTGEAVAKLSLDKNDFERGLTSTVASFGRAGEDINKKLKRSFGAGDAFKGLLGGLGIGSVAAVSEMIVKPFEVAYERAKSMLGLTTALREETSRGIISKGGRKAEVRETKREINDLAQDISTQQKLVDELQSNPMNYAPLSRGFEIMKEAEQDLIDMKKRQAKLETDLVISTEQHRRAVRDVNRETTLSEDLAEADLKYAGEREKLELKLKSLRVAYNTLIKEGNAGTEKDANNLREQVGIQNQLKILARDARKEMAAQLVSLGSAAAKGPSKRGRTETERLAQRGQRFEAKADEAILAGDAIGAARNAAAAKRDLSGAGQRVANAARMIPRETQDALKSELVKANTRLDDIRKNLSPKAIK